MELCEEVLRDVFETYTTVLSSCESCNDGDFVRAPSTRGRKKCTDNSSGAPQLSQSYCTWCKFT